MTFQRSEIQHLVDEFRPLITEESETSTKYRQYGVRLTDLGYPQLGNMFKEMGRQESTHSANISKIVSELQEALGQSWPSPSDYTTPSDADEFARRMKNHVRHEASEAPEQERTENMRGRIVSPSMYAGMATSAWANQKHTPVPQSDTEWQALASSIKEKAPRSEWIEINLRLNSVLDHTPGRQKFTEQAKRYLVEKAGQYGVG